MALSRRWTGISKPASALVLLISAFPSVSYAQAQQGTPPQRIDLTLREDASEEEFEDCSAEQDAASISGEIIVCRRKSDGARFGFDKEEWENRYAHETRDKGDLRPPDPCGPNCGIFSGPPTVGNLCIPGLQKCPPPPAYFIDFSKLPSAPPGSDADRIARGLPPLGRDIASPAAGQGSGQSELGLPPVPAGEEVSPSGSASPEAEPQG